MPKLKDILPVLISLGLPIGGTWGGVAAFWKSTTGARPVNTHLLLVLSASVVSVLIVLVRLLWKQHQKISSLQTEIAAKRRPHRFQDDCTVDEATGMYRHASKPGFFCVACAAESDRESPMKTEKDGWGWSCPVESKHFVRGPNWHYPQPTVKQDRWGSGF